MTVWLQDALGLDPLLARGLQLVLAFAFVVAAIFVVFAVLRKRARGRDAGPRTPQRRLGLVEALSVDDTRRLVLVRRDGVEHLLLIGGPSDVVVETAINRAAARPAAAPATPRPPVAADVPPQVAPEPPIAAAPPAPVARPPDPPPAAPPPGPPVTVAPRPPEPAAPAYAPPVPAASEPAPLRLSPERPTPPAPRPAASLDVRPVRPSAPAVEPATAPRPPVRDAPVPRLDRDADPRPTDGVIRPERR